MLLLWLFAAGLAFSPDPVNAHTQSTAFLNIDATAKPISGEWQVAIRDLEDCVGLDVNEDGIITWEELRSRRDAVKAYVISRLRLASDSGPLGLQITDLLVDTHSDGATYAVLRFRCEGGPSAETLAIHYSAMFDVDSRHRGLLRLQVSRGILSAVFGPESSEQNFEVKGLRQPKAGFWQFVKEGVWHIWHGYDHILFLLAMLLPGVLKRVGRAWQPVPALRPAMVNVLKIVTAFTIAHSITLGLAVLGIVHLPGRFIEAAIAASVAIAALNNIVPFFGGREWAAAFGFGLLHGFGFANALGDLGLHAAEVVVPLLGFNFGVELGQLAIVVVFMPLAFWTREFFLYPRVVLHAGSVAILVVSSTWLAERALDFKWLPF